MQTFLAYSNFLESAKCLDYKRLGKQRVEAYQIYRILTGQQKGKGWINHPAVKMWRGYEEALGIYFNTISSEWKNRGYKHNMGWWPAFNEPGAVVGAWERIEMPHWLGDEKFHAAHRSNLLRKDPEWYGQFNWSEPNDLEYIWPEGKNTNVEN